MHQSAHGNSMVGAAVVLSVDRLNLIHVAI
jgi:hypothetical protein